MSKERSYHAYEPEEYLHKRALRVNGSMRVRLNAQLALVLARLAESAPNLGLVEMY